MKKSDKASLLLRSLLTTQQAHAALKGLRLSLMSAMNLKLQGRDAQSRCQML